MADEITRETMLSKDGQVVNARVREMLGMGAPAAHEQLQLAAQV
jgi:hypothetical protein